MSFTDYSQHVIRKENRQFITGEISAIGGFLPDPIYSQALDNLVVGCADIIPVYNGHMLIGLRTREPQPDWWCFGGRMCKGELYQVAATRNLKRELFAGSNDIEIDPDRFVLVGVYNLIWDKRVQVPVENGCHMLSVTMMLLLTDTEVESIQPNCEYRATCWHQPEEIIRNAEIYHPCLLQMANDIKRLIDTTE